VADTFLAFLASRVFLHMFEMYVNLCAWCRECARPLDALVVRPLISVPTGRMQGAAARSRAGAKGWRVQSTAGHGADALHGAEKALH
jgi:hypothetical protein